ncbi:MAG: radical SAM protein [Clostridiales bacterium]|nr:radical SAM protein [Clostridiales bacterium]
MLKRILSKDRNLILWNSKYYVVNDLTYELLRAFDSKNDIDDISKKLGYKKRDIQLMYKEIEKQLLSKDYYEDNLKLSTPIKVQWKITNKCNLKCKHCYLGKLNGFELDFDKVMEITDTIINSNVMEVTLSGGECLTYKGIETVIEKLLINDIKVDIFTNALLLKNVLSKIDKNIKDKSKLLFYVSVDGLKENHERIRGKNTFDKTIENIRYAIGKGYPVVTNTVINKINYNDIIDMVVLLKTMGVKDVQLSNLIIQGNATNDLKIDLKSQMQLKEKLSILYKEHPEFGYIYYSEVPDEDGLRKVYSLNSKKEEYIGNDNWKCTAGVARVTIDSNGKVYCCPFIKDSYLGDLNNENLSEIWDNVNRYKFLKRLAEKNTDRVCLAIKEGSKGEIND